MEGVLVFLMLTLIMPKNRPDINFRMQVESEAVCEQMAHEWIAKGLTDAEKAVGGIAVVAGCSTNRPEQKV
jgi:hypothetical protein